MKTKEELEKNGECIELKFSSDWKYIALTRQFIQNFLMISSGDQDKADKFSTSISELLENAIKYSTDKRPHMYVHVDKDTGSLTGIVENYSTPEAIVGLKELYATVMTGTPMEAYVNQMKLAATRDDGKSQLGLARIRFEAGANLEMDVTDDNRVTLAITID